MKKDFKTRIAYQTKQAFGFSPAEKKSSGLLVTPDLKARFSALYRFDLQFPVQTTGKTREISDKIRIRQSLLRRAINRPAFRRGSCFSLFLLCLCVFSPLTARGNPAKAVQVINRLNGEGDLSVGAGFFICPGNMLVTVFHVVDEFIGSVNDRLFFLDPGTNNKIPVSSITRLSEKYDLAALKVEGYTPPSCHRISSGAVESPSDQVTVHGFTKNLQPVEIKGEIRNNTFYNDSSFGLVRTRFYGDDFLGLSGAPVFSEEDKLTGIVVRKFNMDFVFINTLRLRRFLSEAEILCTSHRCIHEESDRLHRLADEKDRIAELQMGLKEHKAGNWSTALKWYEKAAGGTPLARYYMGFLYLNIYKNGSLADYWFKRAAVNGMSLAEYALGVMYYKGRTVRQDFKAAGRWFRKSAENGYPPAEYALGLMFEEGHGVMKDLLTAQNWFERSAEQGYPPARKKLSQ